MNRYIENEKLEIKKNPGVIRDLKTNKAIAYEKCNRWFLIIKNIPQENTTLRISLKLLLSELNTLSSNVQIDYFNEFFPSIYNTIEFFYKNKKIKNSLMAFELDKELIEIEQNSIIKLFKKFNVIPAKIKNPHISISYLSNDVKIDALDKELTEIANKNWHFKIKNITILPGLTTDKDYISFELLSSKNFQKVINSIYTHTNCAQVHFPGGFKVHISLLTIDKNIFTKEQIGEMNEMLKSHKIKISPIICPSFVSIFNKNKKIELRKKLRNSLK